METNGTHIATEFAVEDELYHLPAPDPGQDPLHLDREQFRRRRLPENPGSSADHVRISGEPDATGAGESFALAPLVDRIAYSIAKGLTVAVKELEDHIATETRRVGDSVGRRLDSFHVSLNEVSRFAEEQRSANIAVQDQFRQFTSDQAALHQTSSRHTAELERLSAEARDLSSSVTERIELTAATLRESDARQASALEALHTENRDRSSSIARQIDELCKALGIHDEDIAAVKGPLASVHSRVDALVERVDRQAAALRSMHAANSQREQEMEQVMDGLARVRAYKSSLPANGL